VADYTYTYGIFWENGKRATLPCSVGPEYPNNFIHDADDPWLEKLFEEWPQLTIEELNHPLGEDWGDWFIIVNDPETNRMLEEAERDD
jgi:hypothetical protein